ncbi:MAG TPA: bifunctional nuclease domain-containing protein, partial [Dehalococcoidia bacterium]|nr:bifunctional nuclease domain-containing protein [Dehalococcoidia bacterium]
MIVGDAAAEDVAQEATYQAYFEIEKLRQPERFGSWLCGIAVNLAKMALRRRRAQFRLEDRDGGQNFVGSAEAFSRDDPVVAYEMLELRGRIERALALLSLDMRAAVWLHYVEGLTYQEIAVITGIPSGRLRVLSHRARQHLREQLASEVVVRNERRRDEMIEVKVHEIRVLVTREDAEPPTNGRPARSWVVFLKEVTGDRALAIWIGAAEGEAIAMQLGAIEVPRPQTYTLMCRLIDGLGGRVEQTSITNLTNDTFIASVKLQRDSTSTEVDARASDALNLALRSNAAIFVAEHLFAAAGFAISGDIVESLKANAPSPALRSLVRDQSERTEWQEGV